MRFNVKYRPQWFQDFPAVWLVILREANRTNLRMCYWLQENIFALNKMFEVNKAFSQENSSREDFAPTHESANERKIFVNCLNDGTCGNIMVIHQTVRHWLANETFKFWNIPQFHRFRSIQFHIVLPDINIQQKYDFLINVHKRFGYSFQGWNMLNICRARGDGHHYDVTNKRYCVTRVASLAERAMAFSEYALVKNGKISKNCQYSHKYSAG